MCVARRPPRFLAGAGAILLTLLACGPEEPEDTGAGARPPTETGAVPAPESTPAPPPPADARFWFVDVARSSGIGAFQNRNGHPDKLHISGPNGAGCALFDADGDGWLDAFLVNGSRLGGFPAGEEPSNRLYRNQGDGTFRDVTEEAGLLSHGHWGQGCAVADLNGDGHLDLYVANVGRNTFYRSRGDGTFEECASELGIDDGRWSSNGTFFDADGDGDLDLYVANYIVLDEGILENGVEEYVFSEWKDLRVMKGPRDLPAERDTFYLNETDGFRDATEERGFARVKPAFAFQPVALDYDNDGDLDLFVSNDSTANSLWRNDGGGKFKNVAVVAGVGFDHSGASQSCMGVAVRDIDANGILDLFITNFSDERNTLYQAIRPGIYEVVTTTAGLAEADTLISLGWGTGFLDADLDGDPDLHLVNGHVYPQADQVGPPYAYGQSNFLFECTGPASYENRTATSGPGFAPTLPSRGSATGDIDNDGDLDILINNLDHSPTLLRNDSPRQGHFVQVSLVGQPPNAAAIGARIELTAGERTWIAELRSSASFMSVDDLRAHFGLGPVERLDKLTVRWPDGTEETIPTPPVDTLLVVEKGQGLR